MLDERDDVTPAEIFKIRNAPAGGGRSWVFWRLHSCPVSSCTGYRNSVPGLGHETGRRVTNDFELILCRQNCSEGRKRSRQHLRFRGPEGQRFSVYYCERPLGRLCEAPVFRSPINFY